MCEFGASGIQDLGSVVWGFYDFVWSVGIFDFEMTLVSLLFKDCCIFMPIDFL